MRTWLWGLWFLVWLAPALAGAAEQPGEALAARVNGVPITRAVLEKRFEAYRKQQGVSLAQIGGPEQVRVRHILVKVDAQGGPEAKAAAQQKIGEAQTRLAGGDDFAAVAKEVSQDGSAQQGGDLGFVGRGQTVEPFEEAAFALRPGEVSGMVESEFGLHLVKAEERRGGDLVPEEQVQAKIRELLRGQKVSQALQALVKTLREQGKVEVFGQ